MLRTAGSGAPVHGHEQRQGSLDRFHAPVDVAADRGLAVGDPEDLLGVGHLVQAEFLGDLGADLGGVAVDGLPSADDDVHVTDLPDGRRKGVGGRERIGAGEEAVRQEPARIGAAVESLADDFSRAGRAHREDADRGAGIGFFQAQGLFECIQVVWIEDGRQCGAVDGPFRGHRILPHVPGIGHLLCEDDDFQFHGFSIA